MTESIPIASQSALNVAVHRAIHQFHDRPVISEDGVIAPILGTSYNMHFDSVSFASESDPGTRAAIVARTAYAEERLMNAVHRGVDQYVILGTGLDTSALRMQNHCPNLHCFEVDTPAVLDWKQRLFSRAGVKQKRPSTFVPCDFENEDVWECLLAHGFNASRPVFISMLGVATLIRKSAVLRILEFIGTLPEKTELVMDYAMDEALLSAGQKAYRHETMARMSEIGEAMIGFFHPDNLRFDLAWMGFSDVVDLDYRQTNNLYFSSRQDGFKVAECGRRLLSAVV